MKVKKRLVFCLVFCLVFTMFSGAAYGASGRYAVVTEASGTVTVNKAGGALNIRVYPGMTLQEGDWISVGPGGHLVIRTDRDDEITIGENWRGTLSRLRTNGQGGAETVVKTWSGSMYNHVQKKTDSDSSYRVETPSTDMDARGTHFMVTVDPYTGLIKLVVNAGIVDRDAGTDNPVLPSQQVTVFSGMDSVPAIEYVNPEDITVHVSTEVLAKMLRNMEPFGFPVYASNA